jgi:hypothetical protein
LILDGSGVRHSPEQCKMNYQKKVDQVAQAYEARNQFYAIVSPIVGEIYAKQGKKALKEFSDDVRDILGTDDVSFSTLENYAWIHNRLKGLKIADDWSINALQKLASIKDDDKRQKFVDIAYSTGLSSSDIVYKLKYK